MCNISLFKAINCNYYEYQSCFSNWQVGFKKRIGFCGFASWRCWITQCSLNGTNFKKRWNHFQWVGLPQPVSFIQYTVKYKLDKDCRNILFMVFCKFAAICSSTLVPHFLVFTFSKSILPVLKYNSNCSRLASLAAWYRLFIISCFNEFINAK